jgi:hypothetical protein
MQAPRVTGTPLTLRDYVHGYRIYAQCGSCRHDVRLSLMHAAQIAGWDATLDEVRRRLKCKVCGNRGSINIQIVHDGRPAR